MNFDSLDQKTIWMENETFNVQIKFKFKLILVDYDFNLEIKKLIRRLKN